MVECLHLHVTHVSVHPGLDTTRNIGKLTGPAYEVEATYGGSKTLCHISFLELSSTFFLRLTFWAMDSVHLDTEGQSGYCECQAAYTDDAPLEGVV